MARTAQCNWTKQNTFLLLTYVSCAAAARQPPASSEDFTSMMLAAAEPNQSLLSYVYPAEATLTKDIRKNWAPNTESCDVRTDCYCYHVRGDMSKARNPEGWKRCARSGAVSECGKPVDKNCACLSSAACFPTCGRPRSSPRSSPRGSPA